MATDPLERLRSMLDSERPRGSTILDALVDLGGDEVADWSAALTEVSDAMGMLTEAVDEWRTTDDRESKAEAREEVMTALEQVVATVDDLRGFPSIDTLGLGWRWSA